MLFSFIASALFVAGALSSPTLYHTVHEKRSSLPYGWVRGDAVDKISVLPMRIGLTQNNLDKGYDWLMDVSAPSSGNYGKHWTADDVKKAFAPSDETIDNVKAWLESAGISDARVKLSESRGWLRFNATVNEAESLLKTKYHYYEHLETGHSQIACEEYSLPTHLKDKHIDLVYPSVHFDTKLVKKSEDSLAKRTTKSNKSLTVGQPGSASLPKLKQWLGSISNVLMQLSQCDTMITPNCLRALYGLPDNQLLGKPNPKNSYGIVEYTPQAYRPEDLDLFFKTFSTKQVGDRPIEVDIDGADVQQTMAGFGYNGESDLDLEYAMTLVYPQNVTLLQVGDEVEGASFSNTLDAFDGSFCGQDDPVFDASYPDPYGGYQGNETCGGVVAPLVISTSYGYNEIDLTPAYERRQCNEYMKLGLLGTTFLFSSGDYGVAGNQGQCTIPGSPAGVNETLNNGTGGMFTPSFPPTCPYVTAIGATQVRNNTNILVDLALGIEPEIACEEVIFSGGGFSNVFALPSYQSTAVKNYYKNHKPPYTSAQYNNSQQVRGYPDISANGANYVIAIDSQFALVYGTSASSPVTGSILTIINQERLNVGKKPIGFINPVAYAHPEVFNDITEGTNQGCGTQGFSAVANWDPVTGLGTPNFPKMLALWLSLP